MTISSFIISQELIEKFFKFGLVGATGVIVDFGITYFFKEIVKLYKYISNAIGFIVAASSNYFLNRYWTFHSLNQNIMEEYGKFIGISILGLILNTLIIYFMVTKWKKNFYFSKLIAIGIVTIWNFFANLIYTFATN